MRASTILWILAGLLLLGGGGVVIYNQTRGLRNNNPGNIRHGADRWQGMREQQTDVSFVQFIAPEWGIRAMYVLIGSYRRLYGLNTIRKIIARWAPASENDVESYIASVVDYTGLDPDRVLYDTDIPSLIAGIIKHENGIQPYDVALIDQGIQLA